jgi:predicted chitinase
MILEILLISAMKSEFLNLENCKDAKKELQDYNEDSVITRCLSNLSDRATISQFISSNNDNDSKMQSSTDSKHSKELKIDLIANHNMKDSQPSMNNENKIESSNSERKDIKKSSVTKSDKLEQSKIESDIKDLSINKPDNSELYDAESNSAELSKKASKEDNKIDEESTDEVERSESQNYNVSRLVDFGIPQNLKRQDFIDPIKNLIPTQAELAKKYANDALKIMNQTLKPLLEKNAKDILNKYGPKEKDSISKNDALPTEPEKDKQYPAINDLVPKPDLESSQPSISPEDHLKKSTAPAASNRLDSPNYPNLNKPEPQISNNQQPADQTPEETEPENSEKTVITKPQLMAAMKSEQFEPNEKYVDVVVRKTNEKFKDKEMAAMFLAQLGHESGGFQYIEEIACSGGNSCEGQYGVGAPGKNYHGRGFIQLSWDYNYKAASEDLNMGDDLYQHPEKVAEDPNIGMDVSIWFWEKNVAHMPGVHDKSKFGASTRAINGAVECQGANIEQSKRRYRIYKELCKEMGITKMASEEGCY